LQGVREIGGEGDETAQVGGAITWTGGEIE